MRNAECGIDSATRAEWRHGGIWREICLRSVRRGFKICTVFAWLGEERACLDKGLVFAGQTEYEVRAAELICKLVPCAEIRQGIPY